MHSEKAAHLPIVAVVMLALASLLMAACSSESGHNGRETHFSGKHPVTSVAMASRGDRLHIAWVEKASGEPARAWHRLSEDQGESWLPPQPVDTGQPAPDRARRDNDLQLVVQGDSLLMAWQSRGNGFMGAGPMVMARSEDGGESWQPSPPAASREEAEAHGFFDLSRSPSGQLHAVWLDNRKGQQGLHHASSGDFGLSWSATDTLVPATCYCCWNRLHHSKGDSEGKSHLLYRAIDPRDMALLSLDASGKAPRWQPQGRVGAFDWYFDGCPHVGGALASSDNGTLHALVWTGKEPQQGLYHLTRQKGGSQFSQPRPLGSDSARHGDLANSPPGLTAVWDEPDQGAIRLARLEGEGFAPPRDLRRDPRRQPQRPLLAVTTERLHVLWTEKDPEGETGWVLRSLENR